MAQTLYEKALAHILNDNNQPEFIDASDNIEHQMTWSDVAMAMANFHVQMSIFNGMESGAQMLRDEIQYLKAQLDDALHELAAVITVGSKMREAQVGFFKSQAGSRERQEFLAQSKSLEAQFDRYLKSKQSPPPQTKLF